MPEIAIAYFLPTAVEYMSTKNGRFLRDESAVPVTGSRAPREFVIVCAIDAVPTLVVGSQPPDICAWLGGVNRVSRRPTKISPKWRAFALMAPDSLYFPRHITLVTNVANPMRNWRNIK